MSWQFLSFNQEMFSECHVRYIRWKPWYSTNRCTLNCAFSFATRFMCEFEPRSFATAEGKVFQTAINILYVVWYFKCPCSNWVGFQTSCLWYLVNDVEIQLEIHWRSYCIHHRYKPTSLTKVPLSQSFFYYRTCIQNAWPIVHMKILHNVWIFISFRWK